MKIYFSKFFDDYIFVIGGQPYVFLASFSEKVMRLLEVWPQHLKNSRMHKQKKDKEVVFICTVKD